MRSTILAIALAFAIPGVAMAQPLTAVEVHLGEGRDHAMRNQWDKAIEAYYDALEDSQTECEIHWSTAGLSAAFAGLSAQSAIAAGRQPHPQVGQILRNSFEQQLQDTWAVSGLVGSCG